MGRKAKSAATQERRKKTTLKYIERINAGRVVQAYKLMEDIIEKHHQRLKKARVAMFWKSGWKRDKDGVLTRAKISKATEAERERYNDCDYKIFLHAELWESKSFGEPSRRHDLDHELCHAGPEIDDATGEQKIDERERLCWRIVKHKIQTFPEIIRRHGLLAATSFSPEDLSSDYEETDVADEANVALDDAKAIEDAKKDANDAKRPMLNSMGASWRDDSLNALKVTKALRTKLENAGISTMGELIDRQTTKKEFWAKDIEGLGPEGAGKIADAVAEYRKQRVDVEAA